MPNNVREMTNEEIEAARDEIEVIICNSDFEQRHIDSAKQLLDALCAEVERLKAGAVVMRELCEAVEDRSTNSGIDWDYKRWHRVADAIVAYRAMKGEQP